jgi:hypothetical protein
MNWTLLQGLELSENQVFGRVQELVGKAIA